MSTLPPTIPGLTKKQRLKQQAQRMREVKALQVMEASPQEYSVDETGATGPEQTHHEGSHSDIPEPRHEDEGYQPGVQSESRDEDVGEDPATTDPPSMSMSSPWKRKKRLSLQAERMRKAKHSRQTPEAELSILALEPSPQDSGNEQINREHTEVTESGADLPHWSESDNQDSTAVGGSGGMEILKTKKRVDLRASSCKSWTLSISKMVVELVTQTRRTKILKMFLMIGC